MAGAIEVVAGARNRQYRLTSQYRLRSTWWPHEWRRHSSGPRSRHRFRKLVLGAGRHLLPTRQAALAAAIFAPNLRSSIEPFGLTERKSRFLVTVMLHAGVFVGRQYAAFAGITHGQKVHVFIEKLLARRFVTAIRLGPNGRTRLFHVHH